jgi:hypothetical protein
LKAFKRATSLEFSKWYMGSLVTNLAEKNDTNGAFCLVESTLASGNEVGHCIRLGNVSSP